MSPFRFYLFVVTWIICAGACMALATRVALQPWRTGGQAPAYALWLVGVREAPAPAGACRVETLEADGRSHVHWLAAPCDGASGDPIGRSENTALQPNAAPDASTHRWAATLHGALMLGAGVAVSFLMLRLLRPLFQRRPEQGWVRRSVA